MNVPSGLSNAGIATPAAADRRDKSRQRAAGGVKSSRFRKQLRHQLQYMM
jgi:hypothetical protein